MYVAPYEPAIDDDEPYIGTWGSGMYDGIGVGGHTYDAEGDDA